MPSWKLRDLSEITRNSKYTFFKSTSEDIAKVAPGEVVKLIFDFESDDPSAPAAERMWVIVDSIDEGGRFTGRLDNDPVWIKDLKAGDPLAFASVHIISTEHDHSDNLVERYLPRCFVTSRVLHDGQSAGYLYREEPDTEKDSGRRIMAGDESDEYMDESDNIHFVSLGAVLNQDDSFIGCLDSPVGAAFERDEATGRFVAAED